MTIDVLRMASLNPVSTAWVLVTQAPRSFFSFLKPNGWHRGEREIFDVEGTWTNDIITLQNHLQSNYGLLLGCSSFFFLLSNETLLRVSDDGGRKNNNMYVHLKRQETVFMPIPLQSNLPPLPNAKRETHPEPTTDPKSASLCSLPCLQCF